MMKSYRCKLFSYNFNLRPYMQGTCVDIIAANKPAQYLEYSECFNPRTGNKLSDNMKAGSSGYCSI
jgi:hypothetical protein